MKVKSLIELKCKPIQRLLFQLFQEAYLDHYYSNREEMVGSPSALFCVINVGT